MSDINSTSQLSTIFRWLPIIAVACVVFWSYQAQLPSSDAYNSTNPKEFSQKNALAHLRKITKKPHFGGTQAHNDVQKYLVHELEILGLEVEVFEHLSTSGRFMSASKTKNIIAKISGTLPGKALALVSHYDSTMHSSLGASDAGSGVVTIIEGIRAYLEKGEKNANDIIILLTDGEELGLLGAQAFVDFHPWANDIGLVLNFEARGSGGPSYMLMETHGGNKSLVEAFANAGVQHPTANSLMYSIYKLLPNDTDLTVFIEDAGIQGFNFAFIDDHFDYHTVQDSVQRLDRSSLNHHAEYLMPLLSYFSNADLTQLESDQDMVYFNFPMLDMVIYPFTWVLTMTLIATILIIGVSCIGVKRRRLSSKGMLLGFMPLLLSLVITTSIGYFGWKGLVMLFPQYDDLTQNYTYNGHWILAAFISLSIASTLAIYQRFHKYTAKNERYFAPIIFWLLINLLIALKLPGAGFLILPIYFAIAALALNVFYWKNEQLRHRIKFLTVLLALPPVILLSPLLSIFVIGLGLNVLFIATILTCLSVSLLTPMIITDTHNKAIRNITFVLSLILLLVSSLQSTYSVDRKKPNSINYILDKDSQRAFWVSSNRSHDEFTLQFFTKTQSLEPWQQTLYPDSHFGKVRLFQQTQALPLAAAEITVLEDFIINDQRTVSLLITPQRATNKIQLANMGNKLDLRGIKVNGQPLLLNNQAIERSVTEGFFFNYTLSTPLEAITVDVIVSKSTPLSLKIFESTYDIFERFPAIKPRLDIYMPEAFFINDATIIGQSISLPN